MLLGYGILAVPTGIITTEMVQTLRNKKESAEACPACGKEGHDADARTVNTVAHCFHEKKKYLISHFDNAFRNKAAGIYWSPWKGAPQNIRTLRKTDFKLLLLQKPRTGSYTVIQNFKNVHAACCECVDSNPNEVGSGQGCHIFL